MLEKYERGKDEPGNDIYSKKMLAYPKVSKFFNKNDKCRKFVSEMKNIIENWLQRLYLLIKNAE